MAHFVTPDNVNILDYELKASANEGGRREEKVKKIHKQKIHYKY